MLCSLCPKAPSLSAPQLGRLTLLQVWTQYAAENASSPEGVVQRSCFFEHWKKLKLSSGVRSPGRTEQKLCGNKPRTSPADPSTGVCADFAAQVLRVNAVHSFVAH